MLAVLNGDIRKAEKLVEKGADVNAKNRWEKTALLICSEFTEPCKLKTLEEEHYWSPRKKRILVLDNLEMIQFLIDHGADVNVQDRSGRTALMNSVADGDIKCPNVRKDFGNIYFHLEPNAEVIDLLIKHGADLDAQNRNGQTVLILAISGRQVEVAKDLIKRGADIHKETRDGATALHYAGYYDNPDIARLLIDNGAELTKENQSGQQPIWRSGPDVLKILATEGVDVNQRDKNGETMLMQVDMPAEINMLLDLGADIDAVDNKGETAIMKLIYEIHWFDGGCSTGEYGFKNPELITVLIKRGADLSIKSNSGETALSLAKENNRQDLYKLLE